MAISFLSVSAALLRKKQSERETPSLTGSGVGPIFSVNVWARRDGESDAARNSDAQQRTVLRGIEFMT